MSRLLSRIAVGLSLPAIAVAVLAGSAAAQPLMVQTISAAQALKIVNAAIAKCSQPGPKITISVAVVDYAGNPRMLLNADTAAPHNFDLARRKAYTARTFRRPSAEWAKASTAETPQFGQRQMVDVIPLGGGVPIMVGDEAIGGVGISGAMGGQVAEEACARAAIETVAAELR